MQSTSAITDTLGIKIWCPYLIARLCNVQFQKKIHTHPTEGHWKFLVGGGS